MIATSISVVNLTIVDNGITDSILQNKSINAFLALGVIIDDETVWWQLVAVTIQLIEGIDALRA